ncbi:MAG: DUF4328 domain-containing protein [Marinifilaceae bacterium]
MSFKSNKWIANITILFVLIILFVNIAGIWADYIQIHFLPVAFADELSAQLSTYLFLIPLIISIINIFLFIVSSIMFLLWFRRSYNNLHTRLNILKYGNLWATGSWFIPFLNLYRPYEIMREIYTVTKRVLVEHDIENVPKLSSRIIGIWWGLLLFSGFFGRFFWLVSFYVKTIGETRAVLALSMSVGIIEVVLCIVTIKLIRDYSLVEEKLKSLPEYLESGIS